MDEDEEPVGERSNSDLPGVPSQELGALQRSPLGLETCQLEAAPAPPYWKLLAVAELPVLDDHECWPGCTTWTEGEEPKPEPEDEDDDRVTMGMFGFEGAWVWIPEEPCWEEPGNDCC